MVETEDKSPSNGERDLETDKDIPGGIIPLSQGLKRYFEKNKITVEDIPNFSMEFERYLYVKGLNKLHEIILSLEGKITDSYNTIGDWEDPALEELIDTIVDETTINVDVFRHSLISMALKK